MNSTAQLLGRLAQPGCQVSVGAEGKLVLDAPRGAVGVDVLELVRLQRAELIALLTGAPSSDEAEESWPSAGAKTSAKPKPNAEPFSPEFMFLLAQIDVAVSRLIADATMLQAARSLLEDCRQFWREGRAEVALSLARDYTVRIPAYLIERACPAMTQR